MLKLVFFGRTILSLLGAILAVTTPALAGWEVINLHPAGAAWSEAYALSNGRAAGYATFDYPHAGFWTGMTAASWVDLNPPGATESRAYGISGNQQGGYARINNTSLASVWTGAAGSWRNLNPPGSLSSRVLGVHDGKQVGRIGPDANTVHAALWGGTAESFVDLNPEGWPMSTAWGIYGNQQVGVVNNFGSQHASLWTGTSESWVNLDPGSGPSVALATTGDHQCGWVATIDGQHASLWSGTAESWVDLHPAGYLRSDALAISGAWQAGFVSLDHENVMRPRNRAAVWNGTPESFVNLHDFLGPGFDYSIAYAIEVAGNDIWVAGSANRIVGDDLGAVMWHYTIPEPATMSSCVLVTVGLFWPRRQRLAPRQRR